MRNDSYMSVSQENGTLASEVLDEKHYDKIVAGWKPEYGEPLDFGGGVIDIPCYDLYELCEGEAPKLRKLFPTLSPADSRAILSLVKAAVDSDI